MNGRTRHPQGFIDLIMGSGVLNFGALTLINRTVSAKWGETFNGGGIGSTGRLVLNNTTVSFNSAGDDGGGMAASGSMTINSSLITNNDATGELSGGIYWMGGDGAAIVRDSTIRLNSAAIAGGIANEGTMRLVNTTVTGNTATII